MRALGDLGRSAGEAVLERVGRTASRLREARPLRPDLLEHEDAYLAVFDAPGVEASNVQVRFEAGEVVVRLDRFREHYEGFDMRYPGRGLSLDGRVRLPEDAAVDPEAASATLRSNGTLEVRIPKRETGASDRSSAAKSAEDAA
ncbi:MAG: Hsp20/alpha crystallin family protein [Halobacteriales archaeon]